MPKISIIIPVYKVEEYLHECIDSILNQDFDDFEVILVDDGSPDNCPAICDEYAKTDSRITVIHKENGGPSAARNAGIPKMTGDYVWFVDGDDYLPDNAFDTIMKSLVGDADVIHFGFLCKQFNGEIAKSDIPFIGNVDKVKMSELAEKACSSHLYTYAWRNIYKTDFIKKYDLKFKNGLIYAEDPAFNSAAFLLSEKTVFAEGYPYVYRDRSNGTSKGIQSFFDEKIINHFSEYDKIRDENYEKYCVKKSENYYEDAGKFTLFNILYSSILIRIYKSKNKNKFSMFKKAVKTEMVQKAFQRFDINEIKSSSLDWWMFWAVKHKMYLAGHLICKYILFK